MAPEKCKEIGQRVYAWWQEKLSVSSSNDGIIKNVSAINGYLLAYEWLNMYVNHGCDFSLNLVPKLYDELTENITRCLLKDVFESESLEPQLELEQVSDWEKHLSEKLEYWFFKIFNDGGYVAAKDESCTIYREGCIDVFFKIMAKLFYGRTPKVWTLKLRNYDKLPFYALEWNDFVFEDNGNIYFLHLGWSD